MTEDIIKTGVLITHVHTHEGMTKMRGIQLGRRTYAGKSWHEWRGAAREKHPAELARMGTHITRAAFSTLSPSARAEFEKRGVKVIEKERMVRYDVPYQEETRMAYGILDPRVSVAEYQQDPIRYSPYHKKKRDRSGEGLYTDTGRPDKPKTADDEYSEAEKMMLEGGTHKEGIGGELIPKVMGVVGGIDRPRPAEGFQFGEVGKTYYQDPSGRYVETEQKMIESRPVEPLDYVKAKMAADTALIKSERMGWAGDPGKPDMPGEAIYKAERAGVFDIKDTDLPTRPRWSWYEDQLQKIGMGGEREAKEYEKSLLEYEKLSTEGKEIEAEKKRRELVTKYKEYEEAKGKPAVGKEIFPDWLKDPFIKFAKTTPISEEIMSDIIKRTAYTEDITFKPFAKTRYTEDIWRSSAEFIATAPASAILGTEALVSKPSLIIPGAVVSAVELVKGVKTKPVETIGTMAVLWGIGRGAKYTYAKAPVKPTFQYYETPGMVRGIGFGIETMRGEVGAFRGVIFRHVPGERVKVGVRDIKISPEKLIKDLEEGYIPTQPMEVQMFRKSVPGYEEVMKSLTDVREITSKQQLKVKSMREPITEAVEKLDIGFEPGMKQKLSFEVIKSIEESKAIVQGSIIQRGVAAEALGRLVGDIDVIAFGKATTAKSPVKTAESFATRYNKLIHKDVFYTKPETMPATGRSTFLLTASGDIPSLLQRAFKKKTKWDKPIEQSAVYYKTKAGIEEKFIDVLSRYPEETGSYLGHGFKFEDILKTQKIRHTTPSMQATQKAMGTFAVHGMGKKPWRAFESEFSQMIRPFEPKRVKKDPLDYYVLEKYGFEKAKPSIKQTESLEHIKRFYGLEMSKRIAEQYKTRFDIKPSRVPVKIKTKSISKSISKDISKSLSLSGMYSISKSASKSRSKSRSVSKSVSKSISKSVSKPVSKSISKSVSKSRSKSKSISKSVSKSVSQSISKSKSKSKSISKSISKSVSKSKSLSESISKPISKPITKKRVIPKKKKLTKAQRYKILNPSASVENYMTKMISMDLFTGKPKRKPAKKKAKKKRGKKK